MSVIARGLGRYEVLHGASATATGSPVVLEGSELDVRPWRSLEYTLHIYSSSTAWQVFGDNASDYGSEVMVAASATVASGASGSYSMSYAPYSFYRIKVVRAASVASECSLYALMTG